jgi:hypothetical protein
MQDEHIVSTLPVCQQNAAALPQDALASAAMQMMARYEADPRFSLDVYVDVHAHSTSRTSFMFCNQPREPDAAAKLETVSRLPRCDTLSWHCLKNKVGCSRHAAQD